MPSLRPALSRVASNPTAARFLWRIAAPLALAPFVLSAGPIACAYAKATPDAHGFHYGAATEHSAATLAALATLDGGGSAADAAVTAALVLGVVNPGASGLGGGGFALVYDAKTKRTTALDFRERSGATIDEKILGAHNTPGDKTGAAVGIPGEPAGLAWLQSHFGKKSLAEDAAPAVKLAREGFVVSAHVASGAGGFRSRLEADGELVRAFYTDPKAGTPVPEGTVVKRPQLAQTIEEFGKKGPSHFYQTLAPSIVRAAKQYGGTLVESDLASYVPVERAPLEGHFGTRTVFTMPAPSAGGLMLLEALSLFGADGKSELVAKGYNSSETLHLLAEGMRGAYADRMAHVGDPQLATVGAAMAKDLDPARMAARRAQIQSDTTHDTTFFASREGGTSHLVVVDGEGNIVSLTTTVNSAFGSGIEVPGAGFLLNDELWDFSTIQESSPFVKAGELGPNAPRPLSRPTSSMTPTIVLEDGAPIFSLGGSGGQRIATGVTQVALCRLVFALEPTTCIASTRVHIAGIPGLSVEPEMVRDVREGLTKRGEILREEGSYSAVTAIALGTGKNRGELWAAPDPRKSGFAATR